MTGFAYGDLPRTRRWWLAVKAVVRSLGTATLLVVTYYLLPMEGGRASPLVLLIIAMTVLVALLGYQVRAIVQSPYPLVRAIEALATSVPFFLLSYSAAYFLISQADPHSFTESLSRTDAIYFAVTVFATVGFGDISASATHARVVVTTQMLSDLVLLGLGLRVLFDAVRISQQRRPPS